MSTYEDRLTALEQRVADLSRNLVSTQNDIFTQFVGFNRTAATLSNMISEQGMDTRSLQHNMAMLLGLVDRQHADINSIKEDVGTVKEDLSDVKASVDAQEKRLTSFEQSVNNRFDAQDKRLDSVDQHLGSLDKKFDQVLSILTKLIPGTQQET